MFFPVETPRIQTTRCEMNQKGEEEKGGNVRSMLTGGQRGECD